MSKHTKNRKGRLAPRFNPQYRREQERRHNNLRRRLAEQLER